MEEDLLQAVIKVEKEIQQSIEAEKKKAEVWLETKRVSLSRDLNEKKQLLLDDHDHSLERTCQLTRQKAETEFFEVNQMAEYLQSPPEDVLLKVREYLRLILPEENR